MITNALRFRETISSASALFLFGQLPVLHSLNLYLIARVHFFSNLTTLGFVTHIVVF